MLRWHGTSCRRGRCPLLSPDPARALARTRTTAARHIAVKLRQLVPTTIGALVLVFFLMRVLPGDPAAAMLGTNATPQGVADLRSQLGLDKSLLEQFVDYVTGLARLDLGRS